MSKHPSRWIPCVVALLALTEAPAFAQIRFEAMLADGTRVEGNRLHEWHTREGKPQLDNHELLTDDNPLRWLRDRSIAPGDTPDAFVEMYNGDRLPGQTVAHVAGGASAFEAAPPHLLVRPSLKLGMGPDEPLDRVRVIASAVRRIVWQRRKIDRYEPGTLFYRDGRSVLFRSVRFGPGEVTLLLQREQRHVFFHEIAELHLRARDPWDVYYEVLAALTPQHESPVMTLFTSDGAIITASLERFQVATMGDPGDSNQWLHGLQPAWSLEPLWIRNQETWLRLLHAPHEVPLTRLTPEEQRPATLLSDGCTWQRNRSVERDPLRSGEHDFGWGFGVHAPSELSFDLPPLATGFRCQAGLDRQAGEGGCVRLRVYFQSTAGPPAFESGYVVGSTATIDTGQLAVPQQADEPTRVILQADAAHDGRPAHADPLDIRDMVNWYDPLITLDEQRLAEQTQGRSPVHLAAWKGWELIATEGGQVRFENRWDESRSDQKQFVLAARAVDQPFTLSRTVNVNSSRRWLVALVYTYAVYSEMPHLLVSVDGEPVADFTVPHHGDQGAGITPLVVPLEAYGGREVTIEISQTPGDERLPVRWIGLALTDGLPMLLDEMPHLLEPLPANREGELRSSGRRTTPMQITFVNETDQLFHLYWLNSSGERVEYNDIEPHSERTRGSYEGHPWLLTDDEGTGLIIFIPGERDAVALIDEASLRQVSN